MLARDRAIEVLKYFYAYSPAVSGITFEEFIDYLERLNPWFLNTFGKALQRIETLSESEIRESMRRLATSANGRLPKEPRDLQVFYDAISENFNFGVLNLSNWTRVVSQGAVEAAVEIKETAVTVLTGSVVILLGLAAGYLYLTSRRR